MKLISMTDFVLNINELVPKESDQFFQSWQNKKMMIVENYARFLKEPLRIEMFVPCDEDGNVLEDIIGNGMIHNYSEIVKQYQQAKEKVLFLRFDGSDFDYSLAKVYLENYFNIEQLSNEVKEQILTKNAIKRIFG